MKVNRKTLIIAEAGVNHNGSLRTAKHLIDAAKNCGADAIKFQTFNASKLVTAFAGKAEYQKKQSLKNESQLKMLQDLELSENQFKQLYEYCQKKKISFLSSPFDIDSINFLNKLGLKIFKIPSGEVVNLPYLRKIGSLKKKIILSTGMATLKEVKQATKILTDNGTKKKDITVLHCNTEYPTPFEDVNLSAMLTIKNKLNVKVGYSDHTTGIEIPIAAAALGAEIIEKHFTLDKKMPGPDHKASLEPDVFKQMVEAIRKIEKAMGDGIKKPSKSELKNIKIARKSIVAALPIRKGIYFSEKNITTKRPGTGLSPMKWDSVIGKKAKRDYKEDELIKQ